MVRKENGGKMKRE